MFGSKPLHIRFDKADGFIKANDGIRYLVLIGSEKHDAICNRIRYLISQKSSMICITSHNYTKINVDFYDSLHLEKILTSLNVINLIKSVFKDKKHFYYNVFLKKYSYK